MDGNIPTYKARLLTKGIIIDIVLITIQPFTCCHGKSIWIMLVIRSMIGLKQALGSWNYRFDVIIMIYDLIQNDK